MGLHVSVVDVASSHVGARYGEAERHQCNSRDMSSVYVTASSAHVFLSPNSFFRLSQEPHQASVATFFANCEDFFPLDFGISITLF